MSYDTKCFELAEAFLSDAPMLNNEAHRKELAQEIQDAIENWFGLKELDFYDCDVCGKPKPIRTIAKVVAYGMDTMACAECRGEKS